MTELYIKIKNQKNKNEENGKKWVTYELEEKVEYGDITKFYVWSKSSATWIISMIIKLI